MNRFNTWGERHQATYLLILMAVAVVICSLFVGAIILLDKKVGDPQRANSAVRRAQCHEAAQDSGYTAYGVRVAHDDECRIYLPDGEVVTLQFGGGE